jgi:hypothetical protein
VPGLGLLLARDLRGQVGLGERGCYHRQVARPVREDGPLVALSARSQPTKRETAVRSPACF